MENKSMNFSMHKFIAAFCGLCALTCICWEYRILELVFLILGAIAIYLLINIFKCNQQIKKSKMEGVEDSAKK